MATETTQPIKIGWSRCENCRTKVWTRSDRVVRKRCEKCGGAGLVDPFAAMQQEPELDRSGALLPFLVPELHGEEEEPEAPPRVACVFCPRDYATESTYHTHLLAEHTEPDHQEEIRKSAERLEIIRRKEIADA